MIQLLFIVLAAAIMVPGVVGFARGFLRNFSDQERAWQEFRGRFYRQLGIGFVAAVLIGLVVPSVAGVLLVSVLASALVARFVN